MTATARRLTIRPRDRMASAIRAALAVTVLSTPFAEQHLPGFGVPLLLLTMALPTGLCALWTIRHGAAASLSPPLIACAALVASLILSLWFNQTTHGMELVLIAVLGLGFAWTMLVSCDAAEIAGLLQVFTVMAAVVAVLSILRTGTLTTALGGSVINGRLQGIFKQPNELGLFCAMAIPITVVMIIKADGIALRLIATVSSVLLVAALALSASRGSWLGAVAGLLVLAPLAPASIRRLLRRLVWFVVAGLFALAAYPPSQAVLLTLAGRVQSITGGASQPYDARPEIWQLAWNVATSHPLVGVGPGGFEQTASASSSTLYAEPPEHAHDLALTVLAEQGLIGALALIALGATLVSVAARVLNLHHSHPRLAVSAVRWVTAAPLASLTAAAVQCITDMPLRNPILTVVMWFLVGCVAASPLARRSYLQKKDPLGDG